MKLSNEQGIKAVIAESFERIHRSNLVGMGLVPLEFQPGQSADSLGLDGSETFTLHIPTDCKPGQLITVKVNTFHITLTLTARFLLEYFISVFQREAVRGEVAL